MYTGTLKMTEVERSIDIALCVNAQLTHNTTQCNLLSYENIPLAIFYRMGQCKNKP
jgi:hypothetical protein